MLNNHLKRLTLFAQVIRSGSFSGAAKQLSMPRSSVSEQVKQLESALGVRLLQRTTRSLALTPEGQLVYAKAQSIQSLVDDIENLSFDREPIGPVTISITQDIAKTWLIPKLPEFYSAYPDISVNIIANDFLSDLVHEQIDLALRVTVEGTDSSLIGRSLGNESLKLFAATDYLKRQGTPVSVKELERCRWIMLEQMSPNGVISLLRGRSTKKIKPVTTLCTNSPELQRSMMEQGLGIGLHFPSMINSELKNSLLPVLPQYRSTTYNISLVYPSRTLPPRTRALVEFLVDAGWTSTH